ncbi:hypothetical protein B6I21_08830 [candidate division KSB1 bacterium 4572_119]|nr:MAG: hypothetical protein B6I21_08830 [candidate division KSB1 bacterium 4572_119]
MSEIAKLILLFLVGSVAGFINVMAGGGSTLSLPILIFLGLESSMANGTNRIAIFIQNVSAVVSFKQEKFAQFKLSLKLAAFTLPGAIIGAVIAVNISNELFQKILAIVMIGIIFMLLTPKSKKQFKTETGDYNPWLLYPALIGIGFYGGFIQAGVGFIIMATLHYIMRLNLIHVNMHKVFIIGLYMIPAILVFYFTDNINWLYGLLLAGGNAFGAWWAAKLAVKKGEKVIRGVLLVAIFIMAMKLLKIF